jgi:micrococcal nuclease
VRPAEVPDGAQEGRVTRIVDGDTIVVTVDRPGGPLDPGEAHRIRLLEIDTPETVRPNQPVQCGGASATAFARAELPVGSTVFLQADREDKDEYGRYLRYVWDAEGEFYNEKAVAEGYARAVMYRPNDRHIERIRQAEAAAKRESKGIWGEACASAQ